MKLATKAVVVAISAALISGYASAQSTTATVERDAKQQDRIEQGLQSGQLKTSEAASLEKQETKVETMQKTALKDGALTPAEQARIDNAQNKVSADIYKDKHNARVGNPNSASSKRMQADVQRNANQQARIAQGAASGQLTNREVAGLERGQSQVTAREAHAGADGHVGPAEQANIQTAENRKSARIYDKKHNTITK